jgi:hypothetical protein
MKHIIALLLYFTACLSVGAQKYVMSGTVTDKKTGKGIAYATVKAFPSSTTVVTNEEGFFSLKQEERPEFIEVTHINYNAERIQVAELPVSPLRIQLTPSAVLLQEVNVWTDDPRKLVVIAISKIAQNYTAIPSLYKCFYRETVMKRQRYTYIAEAVVDMYKTAYNRGIGRDKVAISKGRRLVSPRAGDTLSVKVLGGPAQPLMLDVVKNAPFLLNDEDLADYAFSMETPTVIGNRSQFVVALTPKHILPYALYYGKLYIDCETLAFTRVELSLDMSDRDKATAFMLVRKPAGVKFKPRELSCLVDYRFDGKVCHISYVRSNFRFSGDWKKRQFTSPFTVVCEMAVTDRLTDSIQPISGRDSFDSRDAFFDKVDYFLDPDFWQDYNIIEPTETLDKAVNRLLKRHQSSKR